MKKIAFVLFILSIIIIMVSCSKNSEYEILEVGENDCYSGANHKNEVSLKSNKYNKTIAPSVETVEINGEIIEVEYEHTREKYSYKGNVDYYSNNSSDMIVRIGINIETGRMDYYFWCDKGYAAIRENEKQLDQEMCEKIAVSYLNQYINAQEYTLFETNYLPASEYEGLYQFTFVRMKQGIKTIDQAIISVSVFGDVAQHKFTCLGELKETPDLTDEKLSTIEKEIDLKIKEIYDSVSDKYSYTYEISEKELIRFANGEYALKYRIDMLMSTKNTDKEPFHESVDLVVYID